MEKQKKTEQKEADETNIISADRENKGSKKVEKVRLFSSIRTKILMLVLSAIILTSAIFLWTIIPVTQENLSGFASSYMKDVVKAYGTLLDRAIGVNENTLEVDTLKNLVGDISINDVPSSYAYVVDADGVMLYHPTADKIGQPVENVVVAGLVADLKKRYNCGTGCHVLRV